jgi:hypothetical protein
MTISISRPPNFALTLVNWWSKKTHRTLHHADTDEEMVSQYPAMCHGTQTNEAGDQVPIFKRDTDGSKPKSKYIMGRRNWCEITLEETSGDLSFDIRVEKKQGYGETVG